MKIRPQQYTDDVFLEKQQRREKINRQKQQLQNTKDKKPWDKKKRRKFDDEDY